jgi:hypothetical protein
VCRATGKHYLVVRCVPSRSSYPREKLFVMRSTWGAPGCRTPAAPPLSLTLSLSLSFSREKLFCHEGHMGRTRVQNACRQSRCAHSPTSACSSGGASSAATSGAANAWRTRERRVSESRSRGGERETDTAGTCTPCTPSRRPRAPAVVRGGQPQKPLGAHGRLPRAFGICHPLPQRSSTLSLSLSLSVPTRLPRAVCGPVSAP